MISLDRETMHMIDGGAVTVGIAAFFNWLPSIGALLTVVWLGLRVLETRTVQHMLGKHAWIPDDRRREDDDEDR